MRSALIKGLVLLMMCSAAYAGFGRSGSSGSFRSSGSSFSSASSARSYSSSSYRAAPYSAPRTVVNNTTVVHSSSGGSSGIHPLTAGVVGYMLGSANHQPQTVVVNGQPQQVVQPVVQPIAQSSPTSVTQTDEVYAPSTNDNLLFWAAFTLAALFGTGVLIHLYKKE